MAGEEEIKERHHIDRLISWKHSSLLVNPSGGCERKNLMRKAIKSKSPPVSCNLPDRHKDHIEQAESLKSVPGNEDGKQNKWSSDDGWECEVMEDQSEQERETERERQGRCHSWRRSYKRPNSLSRSSLWRSIMSLWGLTVRDNPSQMLSFFLKKNNNLIRSQSDRILLPDFAVPGTEITIKK